MGRPIKSVFFGNTNTGTAVGGDNGIGGESVAGISLGSTGAYTSALPTVTFAAPEIPTGVRATGIAHGNALSAVVTAAGTGYNLGNTLSENVVAGNTGRYATWTVNGLTAVGITIQNGGSANDVGDEFTFAIAGFATPIRVRVTASSSGLATAVAIVNGGLWTAGALPGNTTGMTRTQVAAGQDYNGTGLQVNFTAWGVGTVAVADQGNYTAVTGGANATTASPVGGTGATLTITYGLSGVEMTNPGSGYRSAPAVTVSPAGGTVTATLTGTQKNALDFTAWITGGSSAKIGDIINQVTTTAYRVRTADGIGKAQLVAGTPAEGEMNLIATDSDGNTYYVIRLQEHLARVVQKDGSEFQFADGSQVKWTFGAPVADKIVTIANK